MNTGTWLNLLVLFLAFGVPVLGAIWKKAEEQRAKRRALMDRERRQLEMIRTGRDPQAEAAQARQAQVSAADQRAAQRQAQLAELRRRQQERLRQAAQRRSGQTPTPSPTAGRATPAPSAGSSTGSSAGSVTAPSGTTVRSNRTSTTGGAAETARRRAQEAQERARQRAQQQQRQQQQTAAASDEARRREMIERARRQVEQRRADDKAEWERDREGLLPDTPLEPIPGTGGGGFSLTAMPRGSKHNRFSRLSRKDWRRAIVMNEILSPPKSMRNQGGEAG